MVKFLDLKKINDSFQPELDEAIRRVVHSGWYVQGEEVANFEREFAAYIGTRHAVGVGNGLDALRLIFRGYMELGRLKEGDEVIVPANTFIASILAITECRLRPVLVEPDIRTYTIDPKQIQQHIGERTKAMLLVHLYGRNAMTPEIAALVKKHRLLLVEDNAQATGCTYGSIRTGAIGDAAGHSFYPTKNLGALGDGGAVTTNDEALASMVRALGNYGATRKHAHQVQGINSRLDELQAAVLRVKLKRLDHDNAQRRDVARRYADMLNNQDVILPAPANDHVWHLYVIRTSSRDELQRHLAAHAIETLVHYPTPPHRQPAYLAWHTLSLPVTERIHSEVLSLPMSPVMGEEEISAVGAAVNAFHRRPQAQPVLSP